MNLNQSQNMNHYQQNPQTYSLGIRGKLFVGFGIVLFIFLIATCFALMKISSTETSANHTINEHLPSYDAFQDLTGSLYQSEASINGWLLTHDEKFKKSLQGALNSINRNVTKLDQYSERWSDKMVGDWSTIKSLLNQVENSENKLQNLSGASNELIKQTITTELMPLINKALDIMDGPLTASGERIGGIFDIELKQLKNGTQAILDNMTLIKNIEYGVLILGFGLAIIITLITARKILRPLNSAINVAQSLAEGERNIDIEITSNDEIGELLRALNTMQIAIKEKEDKLEENEKNTRQLLDGIVKTATSYSNHSSKVASGDLTQRIAIEKSDEMGRLGSDLNTMTDGLANITKQITTACHNMVTTLDEVKNAVDTQTTGATEQASSINQITSSLEEIEKSSTQTIEKAKNLGEVAERTRVKGQLGLEAVEQSVSGMKEVRNKVQTIAETILELSNQTQQIGEITAVVNTIAQQSKMLALNASIEAAKAGEAGKGFAVVAAEVKNLAEQSEQSTSQVQKILEDIRRATDKAVIATEEGTKGVDHGTGLVEQTGEVVRSLSEAIYEATIASQQIQAAIRQEGIGIEQITAGMNEINQVTSSSVQSVKQTTEAIDNLSTIAKSLKEQIDIYKI